MQSRTRWLAGSIVTLLLGSTLWVSRSVPGKPDSALSAGSRHAIGAIQPRVSPDGSRIAFSWQGSIWQMPIDGRSMRRLSTGNGFDI